MVAVDIEALLPHRNGVKLIDSIIEVNKEGAVSESTVTEKWPFKFRWKETNGWKPLTVQMTW